MSSNEDQPSQSKINSIRKKQRKRTNGFEEWGGYMAAKKSKLENQFQEKKSNDLVSSLFKGISIYVNGYTNPPAEELKRLMLLYGGSYHYYYSHSKTTHIVASSLPHSKIKNLKKEIVVKADWITDSIKAGNLLASYKYLLYPPETKDQQQKLCLDRLSSKEATHVKLEHSEKDKNSMGDESKNDLNSKIFVSNNLDLRELPKTEHAVQTGHPEFLTEFYSHSRLHHISTVGQEMKSYVQHLAQNISEFPGREKLKCSSEEMLLGNSGEEATHPKSESVIMHLDMDCFFVSVGLRKYPHLRGYPVAVTHSKGRRGEPQKGSDIHYEASHYRNESEKKINGLMDGSPHSKEYGSLSEIASCNYEARKAGLHNGMFLGEALRRCPQLKTITYDFESYKEVSKQFYDTVARYTLEIEAVSIDELYIDCTELLMSTGVSPSQFASVLRKDIFEQTQCTASAGLGVNMLVARLATKVAKPNGQYQVLRKDIHEFMRKQSLKDLPGVGYRTLKKLKSLGLSTCADLQLLSLERLQKEFGPKTGESLHKKCRGQDSRGVVLHKERKSVSAEINYGIRFETNEDVENFIQELSVEVEGRLHKIKAQGKAISLKLMVRRPEAPLESAKFMGHGACDNVSRSSVLKTSTSSSAIICKECCSLAHSLKIKPQDYRGVGIQISKLEYVSTARKTLRNFFNHSPLQQPQDVACEKHSPPKQPNRNAYDLTDYVPQQLDESVLNALLPDDVRREILGSSAKPSAASKEDPTPQVHPNKRVIEFYVTWDENKNKKPLKEASLGGAVKVDDVRKLLKEWIVNTPSPEEDDLEELKQFLMDSLDVDLSKVYLILKYFYRCASSQGAVWKEKYLSILSYVQQKMLQTYGAMMEAPT